MECIINQNLGSLDARAGTIIGSATKRGLCEYMGCTEEAFTEYVQKLVRSSLTDEPKKNIGILISMRDYMAKDAEAYRVGAKAIRVFKHIPKGVSHPSELVGTFHKELEKVIREEIDLQNGYVFKKGVSKTFVMPKYEKIVSSPSRFVKSSETDAELADISKGIMNLINRKDACLSIRNMKDYKGNK